MINQVMYWIEFQLDEHSELTIRRINSKKESYFRPSGGDPQGSEVGTKAWGTCLRGK